jgi:cobyrinic acid a,c-diamide synthase
MVNMMTGSVIKNGKSNNIKAIVVAGTNSGCGKTTITLGLMAALKKKGLSVQSFKIGPDFIDAGIHGLVTGRPSRNLDVWMCGNKYVVGAFLRYGAGVDITVIEGVMGMFDGENNTAKLAGLLGIPAVLVVDAYGAAESASAVVRGFAETGIEDYGIRFAGVIFNRVASEKHFKRAAAAVRDMPVLGYLPREANFEISHRHLGLTVAEEKPIDTERIYSLAKKISECIYLERMLENTEIPVKRLESIGIEKLESESKSISKSLKPDIPGTMKLAIAFDKAFCFYYEDNLDLLRDTGFEIAFFSPLEDDEIPDDADAVYIGGGYPELYAKTLSQNTRLLISIKQWIEDGKPVYAECGGLMYLAKDITVIDGERYEMTGVFPFETRMTKKPRLGYREIELLENCILGRKGDILRGHEFHYSELINDKYKTEESDVYAVKDNRDRVVGQAGGFKYKNTLASYIHVHFGSNRQIAESFAAFVNACKH